MRQVLAPLLEDKARGAAGVCGDRPLRVLDPAAGGGAFLDAAADFLSGRLAPEGGGARDRARAWILRHCLTGVEIDSQAAARAAGLPIQVGDFLADPPPVEGPFDAVIGNPPWGGWDRRLPREARRDYRARFATARGRLDPFCLFLEQATRLLAPGGRLGMVLPDYFLLKNYPAARLLVLDNYAIEELAHIGLAFAGVSLDACTLVARREPAPAGHRVRCLPDGPGGRVVEAPQSRFARDSRHAFNLFLDDESADLLSRLGSDFPRLGDLAEMHEGIHSGNMREQLFLPPAGPAGAPPPGRLSGRLRPLILGRDEIRPFRLRWAGRHVVYDPGLVDRAAGRYASLGRPEWFTSPKLLVRRTGDRIVAALDRQGLFASNNLFVVLPRPGAGLSLDCLEAWLNSALATWCFRAMQPRAGRIFAELKLVHLAALPVVAPAGAGPARRILALASACRRGRGGAQAALDAAFFEVSGLSQRQAARIRREAAPRSRKKDFTPAPSPL